MSRIPDNINIKKITPTFTTVVTTMERYEQDALNSTGLLDSSKQQGQLKEYQIVLAVGSSVRACKTGDLVKIDPSRYAEFKQRKVPSIAEDMEGYSKQLTGYKFKTLEIAGERCILLTDNDIEYVVDEYENIEPPKILVPGSKIIL